MSIKKISERADWLDNVVSGDGLQGEVLVEAKRHASSMLFDIGLDRNTVIVSTCKHFGMTRQEASEVVAAVIEAEAEPTGIFNPIPERRATAGEYDPMTIPLTDNNFNGMEISAHLQRHLGLNADSIPMGALVDFGVYGHLYVVNRISDSHLWVTDERTDRYNPQASGWSIAAFEAATILEEEGDDEDGDLFIKEN